MEPIKITRGGVYIPSWGNAERPDKEKITIHYQFLTFAEQQELLNPAEIGKSFAYEARILARMIERVDNLSVTDGKEEKPITNGEDLVSVPGLDELAMECWLEFRGLSAVDKKK